MDASNNASRDDEPRAEMVAEHLCPICGERATLHCAGCGRVFCAEHVARGFSLGYTFVCVECIATAHENGANPDATERN